MLNDVALEYLAKLLTATGAQCLHYAVSHAMILVRPQPVSPCHTRQKLRNGTQQAVERLYENHQLQQTERVNFSDEEKQNKF